MKRKDYINELRNLSLEDLQSRARSLAEELMKLRFRKASGQLEQSHQMQVARRNLARVKSFISGKRVSQ
jgi:ribosomal protein L29